MCIKGFCVCKRCVKRNSCVCEQRVYIKKLLYEPQVYVGKNEKSLNMDRICV